MKRLLNIFALTISVAFAQDAASVASVQFSGEGLSDLETKTLYNYFMGELEKATAVSYTHLTLPTKRIV